MRERRFISAVLGGIAASVLFGSTGFFSYAEETYRGVDTGLKVYDYADLFSEAEEEELREECERLIGNYSYDVFMVTIEDNNVAYSTDDRSLSFLEDFGDENGFGVGEEQDYIAFLIDMDERQYSVDVKGDTCFLIYSDEIQEQILDQIYYDMAEGDYNGAAWTFLEEVEKRGVREVSDFVGTAEEYEAYQKQQRMSDCLFTILTGLFGSLVIGAIVGGSVVLVKKSQSKTVYTARNASGYVEEGSFELTEKRDQFIRRYQTTRVIQTSSSGGGGGSGNHHTTTHRSSGGSRHSGGSRSF